MAVIPVTRSRHHQIIWTLSTALRGRSFLSPAILRATRSTMMGASTPSTPASNPTVYRIAWLWENRIDPNAQEQKANCQNADFHIAFLSVVCLVISFTYLDLSYKFHVYSRYLAATRDVHSTTTGCKWLICRFTIIMQRNQSAHTAWDTIKCPSDRSQIYQLTIGSYVSVRSSRYEARGKFGEHERCVRVARGVRKFFSWGICLLTSWACTIGIWSTLAQLNLIRQIY